ncbi:MAG: endolytic transglycosylase MltG [Ruminococcaceae bacterium]|nr:endolytic transglycosylase MltG [Oscillospiraceae bacterium]
MARDFNDYDELLKNYDNSSRDISSNSSGNVNRDLRPDLERKEFAMKDLKPEPVRSSANKNDMYFSKQEPPTPKRKQNPNSPFYRDPEKDLPTPRSSNRGNDAFKAAKGIFPKSKADAYLDELDKEETRKRSRFERENKKYNGEVYFSNPPQEIKEEAERQKRANAKSPYGKYARNARGDKMVSAPPVTATQRRELAMKKRQKERKAQGILTIKEKLIRLAVYFLIVAVASTILCIYGIGCINDVLAIDKRDISCEVTVSAGATDADVIDILKENKLIKNKGFCKLFIKIFHDDDKYVSGSYTLNSDWGIEKMLSTMQGGTNTYETITLTFPEGYTIDQIAEKLEANKVCTASSFIKTMQSVDFSTEYAFLKNQADKDLRFRALEGYIYPDTYEFYIGENASSVVRRFLDNFESKWTSDYSKQAKELGMTVDEVVTLASIIQAEAANSGQMKDISSVLHNRLDKPGTFPRLECDSTEKYLIETIKVTLTSSTTDTQKYIAYRDLYDTYSTDCKGLPVGAICNPGGAAISAALYPSDTNYNYFRHDVKGNVYYANTFSEHNQNGYKAAAISDDD